MFIRLFLLFTILPIVELWLLIRVGSVIGALQTIALTLLISAFGAALAKAQGILVIREFNAALARGEMPADPMFDGLLVFAGGALLLTPGFITDTVGLLMLFPPTRKLLREYIRLNVLPEISVTTHGSGFHYTYKQRPRRHDDDDVIDV